MKQGQSVINYLSNRRGFVSGAELSDTLNVSTKTIHRIVKRINESGGDEPIIESKRGWGYRLKNARVDAKQAGGYASRGDEPAEVGHLTAIERRNEVIRTVLVTSPQHHSLQDIWGRYYVSDSVIGADSKEVRRVLGEYRLELKRRNECIWVDGDEADIRRAINDLLIPDDATAGNNFMRSDTFSHRRDTAFVTHQLNLIEELMHAEIPYPYNVNLFSHLYIVIERYRGVASLVGMPSPEVDPGWGNAHPEMRGVCDRIIANVNEYLDERLPEIESFYLYQYLVSSRVSNDATPCHEVPDRVRLVTDYLIARVTEDQQYSAIDTQRLFSNLSKHMKPLLNRLENGIKVRNNLLEQIILEYPRLFSVVKEASRQLAERYQLSAIDNEEVGFITVYFAQAMESVRSPVNVLLMCTTGLGTAQLLRAKIEKRFSGLHIVKTVAAKDLPEQLRRHPEVNLVISTINLPLSSDAPILVVSAMLTIEDQERLEREVDRIRNEMMAR